MKLSEFKQALTQLTALQFVLPDGQFVPAHFHLTELAVNHKNFIDCGGVLRQERNITFQLWEANDFEHRLAPSKVLSIIDLAEKQIGLGDFEVEVEYQQTTIGTFQLAFDAPHFLLMPKFTNCLAKDHCGIPPEKIKKPLASLNTTCTPGGGCC